MQKNLLIGGVVAAVVLIVTAIWLFNGDTVEEEALTPAVGVTLNEGEDMLDLTLGFYNEWLDATKNPEVAPYTAEFMATDLLSVATRDYILASAQEPGDASFDPVLCQATTPERIGGRIIFSLPDEAQVMVVSRGDDSHRQRQAIVTLAANQDLWQITNISCANGETAPEREYSFEQSGFLLKSVPPPLDANYWHLVFEQQGQPGHTIPLFFNENSQCVSTDGIVSVCAPDTFIEPSAAIVKGEMQETGLTVQIVEFQ